MDEAIKTTAQPSPEQRPKRPFFLNKGQITAAVIVAALFLIGAIQALTGTKGFVTAEVNDQYLGVDGTYGDPVFLELASISQLQLVDPFDFGDCIEGEETHNTVSGTYSCPSYGEYTVHAYTGKPCIIVRSPDGVLVFNCSSDSRTEKLYAQLTQGTHIS